MHAAFKIALHALLWLQQVKQLKRLLQNHACLAWGVTTTSRRLQPLCLHNLLSLCSPEAKADCLQVPVWAGACIALPSCSNQRVARSCGEMSTEILGLWEDRLARCGEILLAQTTKI